MWIFERKGIYNLYNHVSDFIVKVPKKRLIKAPLS